MNLIDKIEQIAKDHLYINTKDDSEFASWLLITIENYKNPFIDESTFEKSLQHIINKFSKENGSNTPDFVLANYMSGCLELFNKATYERAKWFGEELNNYKPSIYTKSNVENVLSSLEINDIEE